MALPTPEPGLAIGYSYLWKGEAEKGQKEGLKNRPCVVVLAVEKDNEGTRVVVAPITHTPPVHPNKGILIPQRTGQRLGLDQGNSWIIVSEVNKFTWPGVDLRPISTNHPGQFVYGILPNIIFTEVKKQMYAIYEKGFLSSLSRE